MSDSNAQARNTVNPQALSLEDAARILTANGTRQVTVEILQEDIADGAPVNPDGTINLLHYVAWLVRETSRPGG
jgi:hypothetical protein